MDRFRLLTLLVTATAGASLGGCGSARRFGDPDGVPVAFTVHVERAFFDGMSHRQWQPSIGSGVGFSRGGATGVGLGFGLGFSATSVFIIAGASPGQADVFRKEVRWGDQSFTVPLLPGRSLCIAVQAEGGRTGWESLGTITVPRDPSSWVDIVLDRDGGRITTSAAPVAPPPPASASASAAAPAPQPSAP